MSILARSKSCSLSGWSRGSMSATAGCSSVMPVSTSTRASGWSMRCTLTGIRSPSARRSATRIGVMVRGSVTVLRRRHDAKLIGVPPMRGYEESEQLGGLLGGDVQRRLADVDLEPLNGRYSGWVDVAQEPDTSCLGKVEGALTYQRALAPQVQVEERCMGRVGHDVDAGHLVQRGGN